MEYKEDEFKLSEKDLINVQSNIPFEHYGTLAASEKSIWKSW